MILLGGNGSLKTNNRPERGFLTNHNTGKKMNIPFNSSTGKMYSENNTVLLLEAGFVSAEWATYRQWLELGYQVQKGQKSTRLIRVCEKEPKGKKSKYVKSFSVFNIEQTQKVEISELS